MIETKNELDKEPNYRKFMIEAHRRFHDRIVADLNGILPICNQGKCTAADISDNVTEQQQITDLMQKVEQLCTHLSENVTDLFSQYYRERGRFCGAAYTTTAEIKVNLVDRTLLDRSTDVRWWSKEPILANCVSAMKKTSKSLTSDFEEMSAFLEGAIATFRIPSVSSGWTSMDLTDRVKEIIAFFPRKRELMFNPAIRAQFEKILTDFTDFLKGGDGQEGTIKFAGKLLSKLAGCEKHIQGACQQLEMIRSTYPSLFEIVVTDDQGVVLANARPDRRAELHAKSVAHESWCQKSLKGSSNHTHIERAQLKEESHPAIVFSTAIKDPEDRQAGILGSISVFCDFQSETQSLLDNYLPTEKDGRPKDGWFSFFTDDRGIVICANDPGAILPGSHCDLPRSHRTLDRGESYWSHIVFKGRESIVFSACSTGSKSIGGSGWVSHLVAPVCDIMQAETQSTKLNLGHHQLMESKLIPEISKLTYAALQEDRQAIKLISLNGILFASQLGKRGAALAPVFDKITATGDSATSRMESLLYEMAGSEIGLNLHLQETLARQAVDLMSQKIYERSLALRLWARTNSLRSSLLNTTDDPAADVTGLLRMINDDYPVYRNILLLNNRGEIKASSRPKRLAECDGMSVADQVWFMKAIRSSSNDHTMVSEGRVGELDNSKFASLVFALAVPGEKEDSSPIGVLACLFDWQTEAVEILNSCLPKSSIGRPVQGAVAFFTNRDQIVLESTNSSTVKIQEFIPLADEHFQLSAGQTYSGTFVLNGTTYIAATAKCDGRKRFDGLEWSAHILRPLV